MSNKTLEQILKTRLDELVVQKMVNLRVNERGYRIYKYSKKVFFKQLWNQYTELTEARGIVFDDTGNLISYPFTKVFNFGENDAGFDRDAYVLEVEKVNGFLGVVSMTPDNELLITSSGTFDSPFVDLAKKYLQNDFVHAMCAEYPEITFCFEICDPSDPHIIAERTGAHLIGARKKYIYSEQITQYRLDYFHDRWLRPSTDVKFWRPRWSEQRFGDIVAKCKGMDCKIEGYMCYGLDGVAVKVKSNYYLIQKFLARTKKDFSIIWSDPEQARKAFDEEYYHVISMLPRVCSAQRWAESNERQRLEIFGQFL